MSIKRNRNNSTRAFAACVQTDYEKFDSTYYEVKPKYPAHKWWKVLGSDFQSMKKMFDETGIITDGWSENLPLRQLVDRVESSLRERGVKDADKKNKEEKKKDRRKPLQNNKDKYLYLHGDVRKKHPQDGPPRVIQQQPDPEVENWQKHVKRHIFQHKFITDQHLKASL